MARIILKKSSVVGKVPTADELEYGEVAINFADGRIYYKTSSNQVNSFIDSARIESLIDSSYVQARQTAGSGGGGGGTDSAAVLALIDSDYIIPRARAAIVAGSNITYNSSTGVISSTGGGGGDGGLDSAGVVGIIDSAYVQARETAQDFAYSSLTGTPTIPSFGTDFVDSAATNTLIDTRVTNTFINNLSGVDADTLGGQNSAYHLAYANFTGTPTIPSLGNDFVDSAYVTSVLPTFGTDFVDSGYVTSVLPTFGTDFVDSGYVTSVLPTFGTDFVDSDVVSSLITSTVTSAYIQQRQGLIDSGLVTQLVDSAYVALRDKFNDSDGVLNFVDSDYVQARQTAQDFAYSSLTGTPTIPSFGTDFVDSAATNTLIDTRVTNTFINNLSGVDADTLGGENSAYHLAYANFTGTPTIPTFGTDFVDSAATNTLIDGRVTQSFVNGLNVDADQLDGQQGTYYLNYNNFTNTPTIPSLGNDFVDSGQVSNIITADVTQTFVNNLNIDADQLDGQQGSYYRNADNINTGVLDSARVPVKEIGTGNVTSGTFVDARIPNLAASKITSGTFDSARVPILSIGTGNVTSGTFADTRIPNLAASKINSGTFDSARVPIMSIGAGNVTSGTFADARIPNLAASKINSGTFDSARVPILSIGAGNVTSGTFADARIPNLAASKINSGTFDSARVPILSIGAGNVTSGSFADARIPNLAASKITSGTFDSARIPVFSTADITSGVFDSARIPPGAFTDTTGGGGGGLTDLASGNGSLASPATSGTITIPDGGARAYVDMENSTGDITVSTTAMSEGDEVEIVDISEGIDVGASLTNDLIFNQGIKSGTNPDDRLSSYFAAVRLIKIGSTIHNTSIAVASGALGVDELTDLTDVNLTSEEDGEVFIYDNATSKFVNSDRLKLTSSGATFTGAVTGPTTDTLLIKNSSGTTLKTIRGV